MQRVHQDDLTGHLLEQGTWNLLSLPAIATEDKTHIYDTAILGKVVYKRSKGELLDPSRESSEILQMIKSSMGEYNFEAQYQQMPIPPGGAMIKHAWLKYYWPETLPKQLTMIFQSWDTANKSGELNDFSVCTTWGYYDSKFYLLHVERRRVNYPELKNLANELFRKFKPAIVLIEDKGSGTSLIQDLQNENLYRVIAGTASPSADKIMRVNAVTTLFESGRVYLPTEAPWLEDYKRELLGFPNVKFDDQVDSTAQALEYEKTIGQRDVWRKMADLRFY